MKPKKKQDQFDGKVTSWTQKVGVSIIGLLTALGAGLIVYTGAMAATYEQSNTNNEYLTYKDVEADQTENVTEEQASNEVTTPELDSSNETSTNEQTPVEKPVEQQAEQEQAPVQTNNSEAYCNIDGVNVRAQAATGTEIIGNLSAGDYVEVLDRYYSDEWIQVSFEGKTGYVYVDYLTFK